MQALRAFVTSVRQGSFLKAGEAMGLSHGAVSHHIAQLEHLVGDKLFMRHRRGASPTPVAEELARRIGSALDEVRDAVATARGEKRRSVSVTMTPALAQRWFVTRLGALNQAMPDLDLRICPSARVLDLELEDIDIAFRYGAGKWAGTAAVHVADEWVFPVAAPSYRNGKLPRTPEQLGSCTLIRNPRQEWQPWLAAAGAPRVRPEGPTVDDAGLALDLAARGEGIALARALLTQTDIEAGRLVPLFGITIRDRFSYWLVVRGAAERRKDVLSLADWMRTDCARAVAAFKNGNARGHTRVAFEAAGPT